MATLKETAQGYSSTAILNIADLKEVTVDAELLEETDCEFPYNYIVYDGKKHRVPSSVIANLKVLLEDNPNMTKFKVRKSGEGMNTSYTVVPLVSVIY